MNPGITLQETLLRHFYKFSIFVGRSHHDKALDQLRACRSFIAPGAKGRALSLWGLVDRLERMVVQVREKEKLLEEAVDRLDASHEELANLQAQLKRENQALKQQLRQGYTIGRIIGTSPRMAKVLTLAQRVADTTVNVLITGETGTGKELVAKLVHYSGLRRHGPFVAVNCTAVPDTLVESEFFGIEKGVATGVEKRRGLFEGAKGGTLFLDEIGDMSPATQAKLLRVLETGEVTPVGARSPLGVDVRLVTATNRDLKRDTEEGRFRRDLYYRIKVVNLELPPLRERRDDIPLLAENFLHGFARIMGRDTMSFSPQAREALTDYSWPGNIRELENEVERAVALSYSPVIGLDDLSRDIRHASFGQRPDAQPREASPEQQAPRRLREAEAAAIADCLKECGGNRTQAARMLGISRESLRRKLKAQEGA